MDLSPVTPLDVHATNALFPQPQLQPPQAMQPTFPTPQSSQINPGMPDHQALSAPRSAELPQHDLRSEAPQVARRAGPGTRVRTRQTPNVSGTAKHGTLGWFKRFHFEIWKVMKLALAYVEASLIDNPWPSTSSRHIEFYLKVGAAMVHEIDSDFVDHDQTRGKSHVYSSSGK